MPHKTDFTFAISLSVLDDLGRHLYRSFATVLGEAISNAWDAEANNVWIIVDPNKRSFWVKDDGIGMDREDFQNKFLKIGYSKRQHGSHSPKKHRPYIGRKGIGKLALLSCAKRISVISRKRGGQYVGGSIDNAALDRAITDDLNPLHYRLASVDMAPFAKFTRPHPHGTIIRFQHLNDGVRRSLEFLSKILALYFRFSLLDPAFKIFLNGKRITYEHLEDLLDSTQFLWKIGAHDDPYLEALEKRFRKEPEFHESTTVKLRGARGFIASVKKPQDLRIMTTEERVGIDLFVNGRVREKGILSHVPTARIAESYLYGQIHFDGLDDAVDRFTSSREGVVANDPKYREFLEQLRKVILKIVEDWDKWRTSHRDEGDPENPRLTRTQRASSTLYNTVAATFQPPKGSRGFDKVDRWMEALRGDATFNFESYAECFVSENLVRKYIKDRAIPLSGEAEKEVKTQKEREKQSKDKGNISIRIRREAGDLGYLDMKYLANLVDKQPHGQPPQAVLGRDADEFKPMRDAVAHTSLLTEQAKTRLGTVRENIKARIKKLVGRKP